MSRSHHIRSASISFILSFAVLFCSMSVQPALASEDFTFIEYTVKKGDALTNIANQYGIDLHDLMTDNNITDKNKIFTGKVLNIRTNGDKVAGAANAVNTAQSTPQNGNISIDVRGADIRDVLSAIAVNMGNNMIFAGESLKVDFSIQNVSASVALEYLLKTVGMDYITNGTTLIIGTHDTLTTNFYNNIALTRFALKYIDSTILSEQIDALGIPVQKITLDSNQNAIWIQGLPKDLAKVRELISLLDTAENSGQPSLSDLAITPVSLTYISAQQMNDVLMRIGAPGGLVLDSNPMTLWVYGTGSDINKINAIRAQVDIAENAQIKNFLVTPKTMVFLTANEIIPILNQLNIKVNVITFERKLQTVWLNGDDESIALASSIIDIFDVAEHMNEDVFYVHTLQYISAKEVQKRLDYLGMDGVRTYTFDFPELTKKLIVFCPSDYKIFIRSQLNELDMVSETIKVPVDYSDIASGKTRLTYRRDLIVEMTGIPKARFTISEDVSRNKDNHFIMYLEATTEVIQYVKDLIKYIDDPLSSDSRSEE